MPLDVDPISIRGTWFRHIPHRGKVWAQPEPAATGRWQQGRVVAGFYLAESEDTAWAEWYRYLAEVGLRPDHALPRDLWRFSVDIRVANLGTRPRLERIGLATPRPGQSDWSAFQPVGHRLFREGWRGLVAPSAARPGRGKVLCLFRDAATIEGVKPIPPPRIYRRAPAVPTGMRT